MKTKMLAIITAALSLASPLVRAASDYLLELDGIKGESKDDVHRESIEIESFSWGCVNPGRTAASGGGGGAGKVSFQDLHFITKVSVASPQLLMACATGKPIPKAIIHVRKAGTQQEYMTITLTDVFVSSFSNTYRGLTTVQDGIVSLNTVPTDQLSLNFTKVTFTHVGDDGTATTGTAEVAVEE